MYSVNTSVWCLLRWQDCVFSFYLVFESSWMDSTALKFVMSFFFFKHFSDGNCWEPKIFSCVTPVTGSESTFRKREMSGSGRSSATPPYCNVLFRWVEMSPRNLCCNFLSCFTTTPALPIRGVRPVASQHEHTAAHRLERGGGWVAMSTSLPAYFSLGLLNKKGLLFLEAHTEFFFLIFLRPELRYGNKCHILTWMWAV